MALRYLELNRPQYVPTYTSINPEILSRTDQSIQQQGQQARQYKRDVFDVAADTAIQDFSNLPQEDQQFAREQFNQSRQRLQELAKEEGARNLIPFVDEEVSRLNQNLQFHQTASQTNKLAKEKAEAAEDAPAPLVNYVLQDQKKVEYDEAGNPIGTTGGVSQNDLETISRWKDISKGLESFNTDWAANRIEDPEMYLNKTGTALQRRAVEKLGFDEVSQASIGYLLNDPQYRAQLDMIGRRELDARFQKDDQGNYIVPDEKNLTLIKDKFGNTKIQTKAAVPKLGANGKPQYDDQGRLETEEKNITYHSIAEWQAARKSASFAERESYIDLSYEDTRKPEKIEGNGSGKRPDHPTYLLGVKRDPTTYNKLSQDATEKIKQQRSNMESISSNMAGMVSSFTNIPSENIAVDITNGEVIVKDIRTGTEIKEGELDPHERERFVDKKQSLLNAEREMINTQREFNSVREGAYQMLSRTAPEELTPLLQHININDEGNLEITSDIGLEKLISASKQKDFSPESMDPRQREEISNLSNGEFMTTRRVRSVTPTGGGMPRKNYEEVIAFNKNGEIKYINKEDNENINKLQSMTVDYLDRHANALNKSGIREYPVHVFNPEISDFDKNIMSQFEDFRLEQIAGELKDPQTGETVTIEGSGKFIPNGLITDVGGQPAIAGIAYQDEDGEGKPVIMQGELANSLLNLENRPNAVRAAVDNQFRSIIPDLQKEGRTSTTINETQLSHMGFRDSEGNPAFKNIKIENTIVPKRNFSSDKVGYQDNYVFTVTKQNGDQITKSSDTVSDMINQILAIQE